MLLTEWVLSMACDISFIDTLRELEKGALFWEDGALQMHHLATRWPLPLVGSGPRHHWQHEAWQVGHQLDFAPTGPHCWALLWSAQTIQPYTAALSKYHQLYKCRQIRPGLCSALRKYLKATAITLKVYTKTHIFQSNTVHCFIWFFSLAFLVKEKKTRFGFLVRNRQEICEAADFTTTSGNQKWIKLPPAGTTEGHWPLE